jgi:D-alanyl-D-alanine carboxypeptidase/D-alanyl-D-alanine-endopeptidase (penicillin-binding protein 4)
LYAEHLLKKIGQTISHEGSTEAGTKAVADFWRSQNIDLEGFNMADGSGLSRKNLITAKQLVSILLKMKKTESFPLFFQSLPQKNENSRAKSGSMSMVRAYAGYAGNIAFAIIVNHCLDPKLGEKVERFVVDLKP